MVRGFEMCKNVGFSCISMSRALNGLKHRDGSTFERFFIMGFAISNSTF